MSSIIMTENQADEYCVYNHNKKSDNVLRA